MPESGVSLELVLLCVCLVFLVFLMLMVRGVSARLRVLERSRPAVKEAKSVASETAEEELPVAESSPGGAFEAFLEENPERKTMKKSEQFKAYRKWRQAKGLNWSGQ